MPCAGKAMIVAALVSLFVTGQALSQVRDRYDNSIDMRAPLSRQQRTMVTNTPRRDLPDNCYTGVTTDKTIGCVAPSQVTAPPPSVPCTPKTALRNPDLGVLPNTCQ
jgi:hypothetical protein